MRFKRVCITLVCSVGVGLTNVFAADSLRDPTMPLSYTAAKKDNDEIALGAIIGGDSGRFAIINGKIYYVNGVVNGMSIVKITPSSVSLQKNGITKTVSLRPKVSNMEAVGNEG